MKLLSMPSALADMLKFLKREFPEEKRPYLLLDGGPDLKYPAMAYRGMIFPRDGPNGEKNMMWPIIFVKKGEELPRKKFKQQQLKQHSAACQNYSHSTVEYIPNPSRYDI